MGIRGILLLAAVVFFAMGAFGAHLGHLNLLYLGLACLAGALLFGDMALGRRRLLR